MPNSLETQHPPNPAEWEAESLRLTAFLSPSAEIDQQDWWRTIVGELPDRKTSERSTGIQQEEGNFGGGKLSLMVQPTRIDWQLTPMDIPPLGFPKLGPWSDSLKEFHDLMLSWIKTAPLVQRLAFGAVFLLPVADFQAGNEKLSTYLHFDLDKDCTDFFYQINRPRKSTSASQLNLKINRLSKWNVIGFIGSFTLSLNQPQITKPTLFSLRLELDLSTAEDFQNELPLDKLPQIFSELVENGKEIALRGDIK
jgi:hypothetical protein